MNADHRTLWQCLAEFAEDKIRALCLLAAVVLMMFGGMK